MARRPPILPGWANHEGGHAMRSTSKNLVLAAMVFAVAMTFIDQTIVAIAIPKIQKELSLTPTGAQWVINGYLLALSALFAFGGKLGDVLGRKRVGLVGATGFALPPGRPGANVPAALPGRRRDRGGLVPAARARQGDGDLLRHLGWPDRDRP